jgi:hypothetical protein
MWKEAGAACFKLCPGICIGGLKKTTEKLGIVGFPAEIGTGHFPNKNQKR